MSPIANKFKSHKQNGAFGGGAGGGDTIRRKDVKLSTFLNVDPANDDSYDQLDTHPSTHRLSSGGPIEECRYTRGPTTPHPEGESPNTRSLLDASASESGYEQPVISHEGYEQPVLPTSMINLVTSDAYEQPVDSPDRRQPDQASCKSYDPQSGDPQCSPGNARRNTTAMMPAGSTSGHGSSDEDQSTETDQLQAPVCLKLATSNVDNGVCELASSA